MASLQELLTREGFDEHKERLIRNQKKVKYRERRSQQDDGSNAMLFFICTDHGSSPNPKHTGDKASSGGNTISKRRGSESGRSISGAATEVVLWRTSEPPIDEVAIRAVVSILNAYVGQYLRDKKFRESTRAKCYSCFMKKNQDSDDGILANLELGIENIERLVENQETKEELRMKSVQYSIRLLSIVASLNSKSSRNGSTCGIPNSHLSACAQLYLSIVCKIEKNGRISARHLLQVFSDAPFLARTLLLPQLWEHLFLPHLLHLKIWQSEELGFLLISNYIGKDMKVKALEKAYNDHMDLGTKRFALYYKEWLTVGAHAPVVPSVPLPVARSRRYSDCFSSHSSNQFLHRAVFGTTPESFSLDLNIGDDEDLSYRWSLQDIDFSINKDIVENSSYEKKSTGHRRSSSLSHDRRVKAGLWAGYQTSDNFRHSNCKSDTIECSVHIVPNASIGQVRRHIWKNDLHTAINIISISDSKSECEMAVRVLAKAWLDSHGNAILEVELSNVQVIQGVLRVLSASIDDEILELSISILAQIVTKKKLVTNILLYLDPQLDIFLKLLRNNSLFLKAAALLYLMKPEEKQMVAIDWIPLVLRVLEFGDQLQTLFTIQICPQIAAYYFFDQLLMFSDEDKNMENARHIIYLGGLNVLLRRLEIGDISEKNKVVSIIYSCIQADGSCRYYIAKNLNKESLISLLFPRNQRVSQYHAFALLTEIFCLHRHQQRIEFLNELKNGSSLNMMHVLLVYLQRARPEERPVVAVILLQLDLFGDLCDCSVYREEVIEEIVKALDCRVLNEKVQEQSAKALLILGGHFSYTGEPATEKWLLKEAGCNQNPWDSFEGHKVANSNYMHLIRVDDETETWWRGKTAMVLLRIGKSRFLDALADSRENGIPCLARASLVTICWISSILQSMGDKDLKSLACSVLVPQLLEALGQDKILEERALASFSLLNLLKGSDCLLRLSAFNKELTHRLQNLSQVTWTAKELISVITSCWKS